jgi:hypothetical protein
LYLHFRLKKEYDLLSKDKSSLTKTSQALKRLWNKLATNVKVPGLSSSGSSNAAGGTSGSVELSGLSREQLEEELRLAQTGLMQEAELDAFLDGDLEEHGFNDN